MHLLLSSHPHILISLCLCVLACILASLHPHVFRFICPCFYSCIIISSGSCVLICILASSHPHILRFMCACWYPRIFTSSYPQVYVCLLVCSHPQVSVFLIKMNNCILASSSSLVLCNCVRQFVNNLQMVWTGQAFVLDFYRMSRKIYRKQPLRADLEKKKLLKSRQNLSKIW